MSNENTGPLYAFALNLGELKATSLFQSQDETRYQLVLSKFEIVKKASGHVELTLIATNGRILSVYNREVMPDELFDQLPDEDHFCVDLEGCNKLPKSSQPDGVRVEVFPAHVDFTAGVLKYTAKREAKTDEGFPDWRKVVPIAAPEVKSVFAVNSDYIGRCGKACKLITDSTTLLVQSHGEGKPVVVTSEKDRGFVGVVMPITVEKWPEAPQWLKDTIEKKTDKAAATSGDEEGVE